MLRRIHVPSLRPGEPIALEPAEAHHALDVLRMTDGTPVEVFDDAGTVGEGVLTVRGDKTFVRVERADLQPPGLTGVLLSIVAAVPKGDRADWMVEKLSELGVAEFIPLAAARSVVLPEGKSKRDRWVRIATEAAKQSRRAGVMRITELTPVDEALARCSSRAWFLSTEVEHPTPIVRAAEGLAPGAQLTAFIGPEGGWTAQEQQHFIAAGATPVRLTDTVLRIETAAVATAAVVSCLGAAHADRPPLDDPAPQDDDRLNNGSTTETPP